MAELDLVLYGATGFTGTLVAEYLATRLPPIGNGPPTRWALAGRSREKLEALRSRLGVPFRDLPIIVADAADTPALQRMCERTRVVATTAGPFARYGVRLVAACVDTGTDYADITGEPVFWQRTIEEHHEAATERGVLVVPCCGFDSIPHDMGALFTARELHPSGPVRIRGYVSFRGMISGGTWHTAVSSLAALVRDGHARSMVRKTLAGTRPHLVPELGHWALPMPTIDRLVVDRSANFNADFGERFRYEHYLEVGSLFGVAKLTGGALATTALAALPLTRRMLLELRKPGEGPDPATRARSRFRVTFLGEGADTTIRTQVEGHDPGYEHTSKMLAEAALTLVHDRQRLPHRGGVLTPASALGSSLLERLRRTGMTFEVVSRG